MRTRTDLETLLGIKLEDKDGRLYYKGDLNLQDTKITTLPADLKAGGEIHRSKQ